VRASVSAFTSPWPGCKVGREKRPVIIEIPLVLQLTGVTFQKILVGKYIESVLIYPLTRNGGIGLVAPGTALFIAGGQQGKQNRLPGYIYFSLLS